MFDPFSCLLLLCSERTRLRDLVRRASPPTLLKGFDASDLLPLPEGERLVFHAVLGLAMLGAQVSA